MSGSGVPVSPAEFNEHLKEIVRQNQGQIELNHAVKVVEHFKSLAMKLLSDSMEKMQFFNNFALVIPLLPQSAEFNRIFNDKAFLQTLIRYTSQVLSDLSVLKIINAYIRGDFLEEKAGLIQPVNDGYLLFLSMISENLSFLFGVIRRFTRFEQAAVVVTLQSAIDLYVLASWPANHEFRVRLITFFLEHDLARIYRKCVYEYRILPMPKYALMAQRLNKVVSLNFDLASNMVLDYRSSPVMNDILNDICVSAKDFAHFNTKGLTTGQITTKLGFTSNPKEFLSKHYDTITLIFINVVFKDTEMKALKSECEKQHTLLRSSSQRFPIFKFCCEIAKVVCTKLFHQSNPQFHLTCRYRAYGREIIILLGFKALSYWQNSAASSEYIDDFLFIMNLLKMDIQYLNYNMVKYDEFEVAFEHLREHLKYDRIKKIQLRFLKDDQYLQMLNGEDIETYNEQLLESVKLFVINERLMELTKGLVCYAQNPVQFRSLREVPTYLLTVSPKRNSIVFATLPADFDVKKWQKHNAHEIIEAYDSKQVFVRSIKKVVTERVTSSNQHGFGKLLNVTSDSIKALANGAGKSSINRNHVFISSKNVITKITLLGKSNETLMTFYTDTGRSATLCSDTLNLLIDNFHLSKATFETSSHIEQLFDIKRTLQLLPLADIFNHRIIDMYTSVSSKDISPAAPEGNFLSVKINFDDDDDISKPVQIQLKKAQKSNAQNIAAPPVIKEGKPAEKDFEYSYEELMDVAKDFYYN